MAARFGALRHDDVSSGGDRLARERKRLHLADQHHAGLLDPLREGRECTERQHHARGLECKHEIKQMRFLRQRPGDESATDAFISRSGELPLEPLRIAIATADQAQPACLRHCSRQPAASRKAHRRRNDRMLNTKLLCKSRAHPSSVRPTHFAET